MNNDAILYRLLPFLLIFLSGCKSPVTLADLAEVKHPLERPLQIYITGLPGEHLFALPAGDEEAKGGVSYQMGISAGLSSNTGDGYYLAETTVTDGSGEIFTDFGSLPVTRQLLTAELHNWCDVEPEFLPWFDRIPSAPTQLLNIEIQYNRLVTRIPVVRGAITFAGGKDHGFGSVSLGLNKNDKCRCDLALDLTIHGAEISRHTIKLSSRTIKYRDEKHLLEVYRDVWRQAAREIAYLILTETPNSQNVQKK